MFTWRKHIILKITPQIDSPPQKYKEVLHENNQEVLHEILGQPDQKLPVFNRLHPSVTRFPILGV